MNQPTCFETGLSRYETATFTALVLNIMPRRGARPSEAVTYVRHDVDRLAFFRMRLPENPVASHVAAVVKAMANEFPTGLYGDEVAEANRRVTFAAEQEITWLKSDPRQVESWDLVSWYSVRIADAVRVRPLASIDALREQYGAHVDSLRQQLQYEIDRLTGECGKDLLQLADLFADQSANAKMWWRAFQYLTEASRTVRRNRRQAASMFPLFVGHILQRETPSDDWIKIAKAIDQGKPLVNAVAKIFNCRPAAVRHLLKKQLPEIGREWECSLDTLLYAISHLPPEHLPREPAHWESLARAKQFYFVATREPLASRGGRMFLQHLARSDWRWTLAYPPSHVEPLVRELSGALRWAAEQASIELYDHDGRDLAAEALFGLGLTRLGKLAGKWFVEEAAYLQDSLTIVPETGFFRLVDEPLAYQDVKVVQLLTPEDLSRESAMLDHCVETYTPHCVDGRCCIFSVRDAEGLSRSTAEIIAASSRDGPQAVLAQHKSKGNGCPDGRDSAAVNALMMKLNSPEYSSRRTELARLRKASIEQKATANEERALRILAFLDAHASSMLGQLEVYRSYRHALNDKSETNRPVGHCSTACV